MTTRTINNKNDFLKKRDSGYYTYSVHTVHKFKTRRTPNSTSNSDVRTHYELVSRSDPGALRRARPFSCSDVTGYNTTAQWHSGDSSSSTTRDIPKIRISFTDGDDEDDGLLYQKPPDYDSSEDYYQSLKRRERKKTRSQEYLQLISMSESSLFKDKKPQRHRPQQEEQEQLKLQRLHLQQPRQKQLQQHHQQQHQQQQVYHQQTKLNFEVESPPYFQPIKTHFSGGPNGLGFPNANNSVTLETIAFRYIPINNSHFEEESENESNTSTPDAVSADQLAVYGGDSELYETSEEYSDDENNDVIDHCDTAGPINSSVFSNPYDSIIRPECVVKLTEIVEEIECEQQQQPQKQKQQPHKQQQQQQQILDDHDSEGKQDSDDRLYKKQSFTHISSCISKSSFIPIERAEYFSIEQGILPNDADEEIIPKVSDNVYNSADTLEDGFVTDGESNDSLFPDKLECEILSKVSRRSVSLDLEEDDSIVSGMSGNVFETNPSSPDPFETRITPIVGFIESLNAANAVDNNNSNLDDNEEENYMLNNNTSLSTTDNYLNTNTITGQTKLDNVAILNPSPTSSTFDQGGNSKSRVSVSTNGIVLFLKKTPRENSADSSLLPRSSTPGVFDGDDHDSETKNKFKVTFNSSPSRGMSRQPVEESFLTEEIIENPVTQRFEKVENSSNDEFVNPRREEIEKDDIEESSLKGMLEHYENSMLKVIDDKIMEKDEIEAVAFNDNVESSILQDIENHDKLFVKEDEIEAESYNGNVENYKNQFSDFESSEDESFDTEDDADVSFVSDWLDCSQKQPIKMKDETNNHKNGTTAAAVATTSSSPHTNRFDFTMNNFQSIFCGMNVISAIERKHMIVPATINNHNHSHDPVIITTRDILQNGIKPRITVPTREILPKDNLRNGDSETSQQEMVLNQGSKLSYLCISTTSMKQNHHQQQRKPRPTPTQKIEDQNNDEYVDGNDERTSSAISLQLENGRVPPSSSKKWNMKEQSDNNEHFNLNVVYRS